MKYSEFFGKRYLIIILGSIAVYSIFLFFSDFNNVYDRLQNFQITTLPIILLLIFSGWLILFVRWTVLLKKHKILIPLKISLLVFFAGFALSISPVKSGELIKSILLKNKCGVAVTKSIPIILLERFYDVLGTASIAAIGIIFLGLEFGIVLIPILLAIIGVFYLFYSKMGFGIALKILNRIKSLGIQQMPKQYVHVQD